MQILWGSVIKKRISYSAIALFSGITINAGRREHSYILIHRPKSDSFEKKFVGRIGNILSNVFSKGVNISLQVYLTKKIAIYTCTNL